MSSVTGKKWMERAENYNSDVNLKTSRKVMMSARKISRSERVFETVTSF
jgi:hypothetical protein